MAAQPSNSSAVRIDKWLWAARFYKTRAQAAQAVTGGKVHVNSARVKSSRSLRVGDELTIRKGVYDFTLSVNALLERRGSADQARSLYSESDASIASRELLQEQRRINAAVTAAPERRPDKKARRQLRRVTRGQG